MSALKIFLPSAAKIALAIFHAIIALSVLGWGILSFSNYREAVKNATLAAWLIPNHAIHWIDLRSWLFDVGQVTRFQGILTSSRRTRERHASIG